MFKWLLSMIGIFLVIIAAKAEADKNIKAQPAKAINYHALEQNVTADFKDYVPHSLYVKSIADNQMVALVISNRELNRIFVANDRILAVRGIDGAYMLTKDENQGEIFIKPTPLYQGRPINLFITTEQGHNYNLLLAATNIPARTIELKPITGSKQAERWERNNNYNELIAGLIAAMVNDRIPDGYSVVVPGKNKPVNFGHIVVASNVIYSGKYLRGEILSIENRSATTVYVEERQFYQLGTRAIAIFEHNLQPKSKTLLYRVMSNE